MFEDYIYNSVVGNLEIIAEEYYGIYKIDRKNIDSIISENIDKDDTATSMVRSSAAKEHLFKIEEYIEIIREMEDEIRRKGEQ